MNYLLEMCLVALTLATGITRSVAEQSPVAAPENSFQRRSGDAKGNQRRVASHQQRRTDA